MLGKLGHEALAEAHHLGVALALGIEVGAALSAADRQSGEGVLEDLLEAEELYDAFVNRGVETESALVRSDRGVELDAESSVHADLAAVVDPRHAEFYDSLRLDKTVDYSRFDIFGMSLDHGLKRFENLEHRLMKFNLARISLLHRLHNAAKILIFEFHIFISFLRYLYTAHRRADTASDLTEILTIPAH